VTKPTRTPAITTRPDGPCRAADSLGYTLVAHTRGRVSVAPRFGRRSDLHLRLALSSIPRVGHPAGGRSLRAADMMGSPSAPAPPCARGCRRKRTARCHARARTASGPDSGRASPGMCLLCVCSPCRAARARVWTATTTKTIQVLLLLVKKGFPAFTAPQAQGSTGLVVTFKARHASAITDAIMGQPRGTDRIRDKHKIMLSLLLQPRV